MFEKLRTWLRTHPQWLEFREMGREGWKNALNRMRIQRKILATPPLHTDATGLVEVRVLTWRRDWVNLIWALKSFYYFSNVRFPLYIHDGGLLANQVPKLMAHFPNAHFISLAQADIVVEPIFEKGGFNRCQSYRKMNISTRKLFDFFLMTKAERVISIDSDIVFFQLAKLLIEGHPGIKKNLYNQDCSYWYSMPLEELRSNFGIEPPPLINSGLSLIYPECLDLKQIEEWLKHPKLFADRWVTEQTLHALASTRFGVELLPSGYKVSDKPGIESSTICKHYPGFLRTLLYTEGMAKLVQDGFLKKLRDEPVTY